MKAIGMICLALLSLSINAHADPIGNAADNPATTPSQQTIRGRLLSPDDFNLELQDETTSTVYDLVLAGGCRRFVLNQRLRANLGSIVKLTGEVEAATPDGHVQFVIDGFNPVTDVIEPASQ